MLHPTTPFRRMAVAVLAAAVVVGLGAPSAFADDDRRQDKRDEVRAANSEQSAQRALDRARKAQDKRRRVPAIVEAKGTVVTVNPTAKTLEVNVAQANLAGLRGKKITMAVAAEAYLVLNGRTATLADLRAGDRANVRGLQDSTGKVTVFIGRFNRPAPAPASAKGTVASVTPASGTFTLTTPGGTASVMLGTPSIVTLNNLPATLAEIRVGDKGEAIGVTSPSGALVAYVASFTRPAPASSTPVRLKGTVASVTPASNSLVVTVNGIPVTLTMASPALISVNDVVATLADVRVGDKVTATALNTGTGLVAFFLAATR
jgi:hypothetical protein